MELQNIEKFKFKDRLYFFIKNRDRLRRFFTLLAIVLGIPASITTIIVGYNHFSAEPNIECSLFTKCKAGNVVIYSGELINNSSYHAKEFTLTGKFNSKIIRFEVNCNDAIEKPKSMLDGSIKISLKRFSGGGNKCNFDIIVDQDNEITENIQAIWGNKGKLNLQPNKCDEKMERGIALGGQISKLDPSRKARQKWLENNAKNIR